MKIVQIKCDACDRDLTDAGAMPTYRLELAPAAVRNSGGIMYGVAVYPPIDRAYHFCGLSCLDLWRDRERHKDGLWRARNEEWKQAHGHKDQNGRINSWRSMPDDVRAAAAAEIDAAALVAFPIAAPQRS